MLNDVIVMLIIQIDINNTNFKTEKTRRIVFNMKENTKNQPYKIDKEWDSYLKKMEKYGLSDYLAIKQKYFDQYQESLKEEK